MAPSYYPPTNDGRADWWQNIIVTIGALEDLGFTTDEIASITADAKWGVYLYRTVREAYEELHKGVVQFADEILDGPIGATFPTPPPVPAWPTVPPVQPPVGIEARRAKWVAEVKKNAGYTETLGTTLKIETPASPFDPATYQAQLSALASLSAHTVTGKFRKAGGQIDGINFYGRKEGTATWLLLGRFNATPFSALVPLAGTAPEAWDFQARAVKRDVEIGLPSAILPLIVRG